MAYNDGVRAMRQQVTLRVEGKAKPMPMLNQELIDLLDRRGAPGELLKTWASIEKKVWDDVMQQGPGLVLSRPLRQAVLLFLEALLRHAGLEEKWPLAVQILDLLCSVGEVNLDSLPVSCCAIVSLIWKNAGADCQAENCTASVKWGDSSPPPVDGCSPRVVLLAQRATQIAVYLRGNGLHQVAGEGGATDPNVKAVCPRSILVQEKKILRALHFRMGQPSATAWARALLDRIDTILGFAYTRSIQWMKTGIESSCKAILKLCPVSKELTPRTLSTGLVCLYLVLAQLAPLESFCPQNMGLEDWVSLFGRTQDPGNTLPSCGLSETALEELLAAVYLATGRDSSSLAKDAFAVASRMAEVQ